MDFNSIIAKRVRDKDPQGYGIIAQLGEHLPYKQGVIGSSPIVSTYRNFIQIHGCRLRNHCGLVVQLVRMPACHAGGRGFEPLPGRQIYCLLV